MTFAAALVAPLSHTVVSLRRLTLARPLGGVNASLPWLVTGVTFSWLKGKGGLSLASARAQDAPRALRPGSQSRLNRSFASRILSTIAAPR